MKDLRYALLLSLAAITAVPGAALAVPKTPIPRLACYTQLKDGRIIDLSSLCRSSTKPNPVPATLEQAAIEGEQERARIQANLLSKNRAIDPANQILHTVPALWR